MNTLKHALWSWLLLLSANCFSQSAITVTGTVKDASLNPLEGATVRLNRTGAGTSTDKGGQFRITASEGDSLIVSFVGFVTQRIAVTGKGEAGIITMAPEIAQAEAVVVIGYGTSRKATLTASVATIKGADIAKQPVGDLSNALGGRVAGVLFTQPSGQAGNDAANILIRGIGTNGNSQPLLIVDGIYRNFSQLNPSDIESISILKDAAAVAPYGIAGANGVVLVTTKRGKVGRPVLSYDGWVGMQSPTIITKYVNSYQYATMKNIGADNEGNPEPFSAEQVQKYKDGSDPDAYPNTNAVDAILKRNVAQTSHSLGLSGGTDKIRYSMGLGYYYQDGALPNLNYKRYNLSASLSVQATNTTKVELAINDRAEERNLTAGGFDINGIFENLVEFLPIDPLRFSNGDYTQAYANFYANNSYQKVSGYSLLNQFSIEQQLPLKGLSVKFVGSYDFNPSDPFSTSLYNRNTATISTSAIQSLRRSWNQPYPYYTIDTTVKPYVYTQVTPTAQPSFYEEYHQTQAFTYQGYLNYAGKWGRSAVTGLLVLESRDLKATRFSAGRINYQIPVPELFAGSSNPADLSNDGTSLLEKQRSLVYRVTYGFANKYLVEALGRYDGQYYFAPGHRFGFFPAFSAAWRLSQEPFIKRLNWIKELKVRGSYGESGQLAGSPFQYQTSFILYGNSAALNGTSTQGLYESAEANPNITWEKAKKTDIGLESSLWNGLLTLEADYFFEKRDNMLIAPNVTVPVEYGIGLSQVNAGVMQNQGFEITLGGSYNFTKNLSVSLNTNFTYAKNKLIQVFETGDTYNNPNRRVTGRSLGTPFGYKALGYFTEADFDADGNLAKGIATQPWGQVQPGDIRYADLNNDGVIDVNDQTVIGNPTYPAIIYGFTPTITYKNFELSLLFQGAAKRGIQLYADAVWAFFNGKNAPVTALDYWTSEHTDAVNPRLTQTPTENNTQTSSWWQRDASYLRLRTGIFSYSLPVSVAKSIGMSNVKVYLSGQNLITWTPLKNFDPEVNDAGTGNNSSRGNYFPTMKSVTVGLNVQF